MHVAIRQRRDHAVAGRGVVEADDVAGLLAAEIEAAPRPCARRRSGRRPACARARCRARAAPPRGRSSTSRWRRRVLVASAVRARASQARGCASTWSPSTSSPCSSTRIAAVGVAVERDADVGAFPPARARAATSTWSAPQPSLMLCRRAALPMATTSAPSSEKHHRRDAVGRAVRAVDDDAQPVERQLARQHVLQEHVVAAVGVVDAERLADAAGRSAACGRVSSPKHQLLDGGFGGVGELEAVGAEELDAVVLERVVRCGDRDAGVGAQAARQERDAGRRHRADQQHVHAHRAEPGGERRLEHVARQARVLADDDLVAAIAGRSGSTGRPRDRAEAPSPASSAPSLATPRMPSVPKSLRARLPADELPSRPRRFIAGVPLASGRDR